MINFDIPLWVILQTVAATVAPLLVGLVTVKATAAGTKAVLLAALSLVSSLLTQTADAMQHGTSFNLGLALVSGLVTFATSTGLHFGLLKPTGASAVMQAIGAGPGAANPPVPLPAAAASAPVDPPVPPVA